MRYTHTKLNRISLSLLFLILVGYSFPAHASELEIGRQWYERRSERANGLVADPRAIDRAIYFLGKALEHRATEEEAGILLLKSYYFKGQFASQGEQKRKVFGEGKELGERLIRQFPNSPGLRLFYSANLGKWAECSGVLAAAQSRIPDTIRENAEEILKIDPNYDRGAGYYLLGAIYFKAPYIPFLLSWPDNKKAIANLKKALAMAPDSLGTKLILAQALLRQGDRHTAIAMFEDVARQTPKPTHLLEDRAYIHEAQTFLSEQRPAAQTTTNESY
jgi:tetratricopeptide (TPR) repeat protein